MDCAALQPVCAKTPTRAARLQLRFTFTNVATRGATYNFTVQGRNSLGLGPASAVVRFTVPSL